VSVDAEISFIHALTKHLFNIPEDQAQEIFIGVQPRGERWRVRVTSPSFFMEEEAEKLSEALGTMVEKLTAKVTAKLDEGAKLLGQTET